MKTCPHCGSDKYYPAFTITYQPMGRHCEACGCFFNTNDPEDAVAYGVNCATYQDQIKKMTARAMGVSVALKADPLQPVDRFVANVASAHERLVERGHEADEWYYSTDPEGLNAMARCLRCECTVSVNFAGVVGPAGILVCPATLVLEDDGQVVS